MSAKPRITIVDYGMGNLFSVSRALEHVGAEPVFAKTAAQIEDAERLILPGVGAFADGMAGLQEQDLIPALQAYGRSGRPLLGICLGMQMLLDVNEEFGIHQGLGLIPGRVCAIPKQTLDQRPHKIPHIGWTALRKLHPQQDWTHPGSILQGIPEQTRMYFVHSFTAFPSEERFRLADSDYNGQRLAAVVQSGAISGCQFHPEKSGPWGLRIIQNFVSLPLASAGSVAS